MTKAQGFVSEKRPNRRVGGRKAGDYGGNHIYSLESGYTETVKKGFLSEGLEAGNLKR